MKNNLLPRSKVKKKSKYSDYKQELRKDFLYSCAYCTTSEKELHKDFQIDHYLPQSKYPELANDYLNLIWSCQECNNSKDDYDSNATKKIFRPDKYDYSEHFELVGKDRLNGKTPDIGIPTVMLLNLNSKRLRTLRFIRSEENKLREEIAFGIHSLRILIRKNQNNIEIIKRLDALNKLKTSFEDSLLEIAKTNCSSYEHNEDPDKKEYLKQKKDYLKSLI